MFKFPKLFGRGVSTPVVDESAPFKENIQEIENDIPAGDELSDKIDSLVKEVESQPLPYNAANIFVVDKSGNKISIDKHRENLAKADQIKIKEVRQKIKTNELPDLVSSEVLELDKEIEALDEKIADPEAGVSNQEVINQILAKNQIKMSPLQLEREAKERALDVAINNSGSFTALRKVLTDLDYEKKDEVLSLIARAETVVKDAYAKGENFQAFSPTFVNLIPNEYGLPLKIRQIGVAISDGLNKKLKGSGRRPAEDSKSRIIFPPAPTKESELEDLKKRIALANESPEMAEKREQDVIVRANLANLAVRESETAAKKVEFEAQEKAKKENDERYRSSRWLDPNKVLNHPRGYEPKEVDHDKEIAMFHEALEKNREVSEVEKESTAKIVDTRSSQDLGIDLEGIKNISSESGEEESGLKIIDKRSSRDLTDTIEDAKPRTWEISDKRSIKPTANESLVISEKEIAEALAKSDSPVNKELLALDASLGDEVFSIEAAKKLLETLPASEIAAVEKKNLGFWGKAKSILANPKVQAQLLTAGISSAASVLGFKAFYDVPAYFSQRYAVRGNVFGLGKGKGLEGSVKELINASQNKKSKIDEKSEAGKSSVMEAIKDLDKRLAKTKEGSKKGSEQRKKLSILLGQNRHRSSKTVEERHKELDDILDNYTSTKVNGIQAIRETLNTALVASGAFVLRGVTYGGLAYFEKLDEIRRQARVEMAKGDSSLSKEFIKNKVEETVGIKQVFARGLKETFDGVRLKSGKNKTEKTLAAIKSWGSIARFTGIALGIGGGQIYQGASLDKIIDAVEGKLNLAGVGHNFYANAQRLIPSFGTVEAATSVSASPDALPAEIIQPQIQNIVAEKMNLNENNSESINNLDKMLKGNSSETVVPINKIASVLPTEEITAAVGSPEHVQAFLADSENKKTLETLSEKAEDFFNPRISQAERNAAGADINSLKAVFEKEFGARMSFDLDGDVTLRYPDGRSLKIFEGDGRNFVAEHNLAASQTVEVSAGTESGNPLKVETISPVTLSPETKTEGLDFSKAFDDEKSLPQAEVEVLPKPDDNQTTENLKEILDKIDNKPVTPEIAPEANLIHETATTISPDIFKSLDVDPMANFPQEKLVFAGNFPAADRSNLEEYFKHSLAERNEVIKQLGDWKAKYGDRPQYADFEAGVKKLLNNENHVLESVIKAAAGQGKVEAFTLGDMAPDKVADMQLGALAGVSKLKSLEEASTDAFAEMDKARAVHGRAGNAFKPLEDAVSTSKIVAPTVSEISSPEVVENVSTMTLAEARNFDQPLNSSELAKNLVEQGKTVDLRRVPSVSPEALKVWQNEQKTFVLTGLKPEFLDKESALILRDFKGQVLLSNEVLEKMENLTSSHEAVSAGVETVNKTIDQLQPLAPEVVDNMNKELSGLDGALQSGSYLKFLNPKAANEILEKFGDSDARRNGIEMDVDKIKSIVLTMKNNNDPKMLAAMQQNLKNWIVGSENNYSKYLDGKKIYGDSLRRLAGIS